MSTIQFWLAGFVGEGGDRRRETKEELKKREKLPWNENPNIASTRMSKLSDKSIGRSSTDRKGIDSDSSYKRNPCIRYTIYKNSRLQFESHPYLSHQTIIKRFGSTLWVTNNWLITKVMKMTSRNEAITAIIPWTTNSKDSTVFARFINLLMRMIGVKCLKKKVFLPQLLWHPLIQQFYVTFRVRPIYNV